MSHKFHFVRAAAALALNTLSFFDLFAL